MNNLFIPVILLFFFSCLFGACNCSSEKSSGNDDIDDDFIKITHDQFMKEKMQTGKATVHEFEEIIKVNGFILAPSSGTAQISSYIPGTISNIHSTFGGYVYKGQLLFSISSKEIIILQQDYAETANKLNGLRVDYQRSKSLLEEEIGSQKDFIAIESEYKSILARYEGLKSQLRLMNLDPKSAESGSISQFYHIYAPIGGYITKQNCIIGKYCEPNEVLIEIVDINQLQLQLAVFEKDISKLNVGQTIRFSLQDRKDLVYNAKLSAVGKSVDEQSKTVLCIADLKKEDCTKFVNRIFVEAEIIADARNTLAVPDEAIVKSGENYYIFLRAKQDNEFYYFKKLKIKIGAVSNGYTEISGSDSLNNLVIKGVYNLQVE